MDTRSSVPQSTKAIKILTNEAKGVLKLLEAMFRTWPLIFVGYSIIGTIVGLYTGICAIAARNPMEFSEKLLSEALETEDVARKKTLFRCGLGVAAFTSLFFPFNICLGIGLMLFLANSPNENDESKARTFLSFTFFAWIIGIVAVQSGMIPLAPES